MTVDQAPALHGMNDQRLAVRSARLIIDRLEVMADIGFHDFEIGKPQRLWLNAEVWLDDVAPPAGDDPDQAWNYDFLKTEMARIAQSRRWNLQETLLAALFDRIASVHGVRAIRLRSIKPDVYAEAAGVGVEIASFDGLWPPA